jgi:hypothetical protein
MEGNSSTPSVPDFITHYHPSEDPPFQNLVDAPAEDLPAIIEALQKRREDGSKRIFGRVYMDYRRDTEAKLRRLFEDAGGRPERKSPHYFVLGTSRWFAGLYRETRSVRLSIRDIRSGIVSFTYPDSGVAMRLGPKYGLPPDPMRPYHEKVFLVDHLPEVVATYGLPADPVGESDDGYTDYHRREFEKYIEVQVWSDEPVKHVLR